MRWSALVVLWLAAAAVWAQEGALQADFRREGEHFSEACGKFGLKTVAEFVEDQSTADVLIELGVDYAQGYHYGRPEKWKQ